MLDALDNLPEPQKQLVREHLNDSIAEAVIVDESPFKRLAQLAIESTIEFDPAFDSQNPDDLVETEFGNYLLTKLNGSFGTAEYHGSLHP